MLGSNVPAVGDAPIKSIEKLEVARRHVMTFGTETRTMIAAGITVVTWASAFAGIRLGLQSYSPAHVALLRYLTASVVLVIYALITRMPLPKLRDIPAFLALGGMGITIYNVALGYGQINVQAATAAFIVASAPVWMALLARLIFKEQLRIWGWIGISVSFGSVTIIALGKSGGLEFNSMALAILAAAFAQSVYSIGQKPLLARYSALQCTAYALWAGTLFLLPFSGGFIKEVQEAPFNITAAVIYLGIVPGALGYVMWSYALARVNAARAGSFLYMVPPFALIIAWLWLGEVPPLMSVVGGILVLIGVILVNTFGKVRKPA
jgi:drug/metabolite transporter (DMT)-like permease